MLFESLDGQIGLAIDERSRDAAVLAQTLEKPFRIAPLEHPSLDKIDPVAQEAEDADDLLVARETAEKFKSLVFMACSRSFVPRILSRGSVFTQGLGSAKILRDILMHVNSS